MLHHHIRHVHIDEQSAFVPPLRNMEAVLLCFPPVTAIDASPSICETSWRGERGRRSRKGPVRRGDNDDATRLPVRGYVYLQGGFIGTCGTTE